MHYTTFSHHYQSAFHEYLN